MTRLAFKTSRSHGHRPVYTRINQHQKQGNPAVRERRRLVRARRTVWGSRVLTNNLLKIPSMNAHGASPLALILAGCLEAGRPLNKQTASNMRTEFAR